MYQPQSPPGQAGSLRRERHTSVPRTWPRSSLDFHLAQTLSGLPSPSTCHPEVGVWCSIFRARQPRDGVSDHSSIQRTFILPACTYTAPRAVPGAGNVVVSKVTTQLWWCLQSKGRNQHRTTKWNHIGWQWELRQKPRQRHSLFNCKMGIIIASLRWEMGLTIRRLPTFLTLHHKFGNRTTRFPYRAYSHKTKIMGWNNDVQRHCKEKTYSQRKLLLDWRPGIKTSQESVYQSCQVMASARAPPVETERGWDGGVALTVGATVASILTAGRTALGRDAHKSVTQPGRPSTSSSLHGFPLRSNLMISNGVLI